MKVYLAGPMRGYPLYNFPAFLGAAQLLRRVGFEVTNPAEHDLALGVDPAAPLPANFDLKAVLGWDLQQVLTADAVVVLDGWDRSAGALAEVATANAVGTPVWPLADALQQRASEAAPDAA